MHVNACKYYSMHSHPLPHCSGSPRRVHAISIRCGSRWFETFRDAIGSSFLRARREVCICMHKYAIVCLLVSPRLPRRPCSSFLMHGAARTERRRAPKLANCPMATFGLATGRRRSANVRWSSIRHFSAALVGGHCSGGPSSGASACERRPAQCPRRESK